MATTTATLVPLSGVCSDGVTKACKIEVEGPDGSFTWCGGQDQLESLWEFLGNLRQVDPRIMARLSLLRGAQARPTDNLPPADLGVEPTPSAGCSRHPGWPEVGCPGCCGA